MTTIGKLINVKYGNVYRFAKAMGWSYQRAKYIATKNPNDMNLKKLKEICSLLDCKITDII